jgi:DNA ligase-associated metallophosphoesterase
MIIDICGTQVQLLAQKAIYIVKQKVLVIADMHLGKLVHFRRNGIFIPTPVVNQDLKTLVFLIEQLDPKEVVFLGDLFHSEKNSEYYHFLDTINLFPTIQFTLTKGNHDVIPEEIFKNSKISIVKAKELQNNIVLMHQLPKHLNQESFYIVGHIHPGYRFETKGRQSYRLSCFHLGVHSLTLPAFGMHTGLFIPEFLETDKVYVIMNDEVIKVPN